MEEIWPVVSITTELRPEILSKPAKWSTSNKFYQSKEFGETRTCPDTEQSEDIGIQPAKVLGISSGLFLFTEYYVEILHHI